MSLRHSLLSVSALAAAALVTGCHNDHLPDPVAAPITAQPTGDTVALTASGKVVSFNRAPSSALISSQPVTGLASGETLVGIDLRPANSTIYALSSKGVVYKLDPSTGVASAPVTLKSNAATPINTTACTPAVTAYTALAGSEFGLDFNPVPDRLRVVSNSGQSLRINVDTGDTTVDCAPMTNGTARTVSAVAYTNSTPGAAAPTSTTLFFVDSTDDMLYSSTAPNNGSLTLVGPLGKDVSAVNGFDIIGASTAYAVFTVGSTTGFYTIDLTTGAATAVANFVQADPLRGLALK